MSCRTTCACQCQNSACGCLEPGKQPPPRPKPGQAMSVCAHRPESPGSFTSCQQALGKPCVCGAQVESEQEAACATPSA